MAKITEIIDNIKIGKTGSAMLVISGGTYIAGTDPSKIQNAQNITSDKIALLQKLEQK